MATVAFNQGVRAIDLPTEERQAVIERIVIEVRLILRGAQAEAVAVECNAEAGKRVRA
ncbi:MAG: hypothetical protein ACI8W3_002281 [Myxococcota bacterium]|jgi:hypothetical protein